MLFEKARFGEDLQKPCAILTGKERDNESGLDFFGARYYWNSAGRFTSPDVPLLDQTPEDPQSWNLYTYARNNPLVFVDPTGEAIQLTGNEEERKKQLEALRSAVGEQAGAYLYENKVEKKNKDGSVSTEYYVGIYTDGPSGKGPDFRSLNEVSDSLGQIVGSSRVAQLAIVPEGTRIEGTLVAPSDIRSVPLLGEWNFGGVPAVHFKGRVSMLGPGKDPGLLPGSEMSDGRPGRSDWGMIVMHELGHATMGWGLVPPYEFTNERARALENQVRRLRNPSGPTRRRHD